MGVDDTYRETITAQVLCDGTDITSSVVFANTSFQTVAGAQPGTATITCRGAGSYGLGKVVEITLNGTRAWRGFLMNVEQGYFFEAVTEPKTVLHCVDFNILFDKLVLYNHDHPNQILTGGGAYTDGTIPTSEADDTFLTNMLADTDLSLISPTISTSGITHVGDINPDGKGTVISPGATMRALFNDVAGSVYRTTPGAIIFYINPDGEIVYAEQDTDTAPWSVGDDSSGVNVSNLSITSDISGIKNDVLVFAGSLNPTPGATQEYLYYRHNSLSGSVTSYGMWQYAEQLPNWSQAYVDARSTKILYQEGTPAKRVTFTTWRSGLFPGQILTVSSTAHSLASFNVPIRAIEVDFPVPDMARYRVTASFNTQDPYGLLLALKRPPTRGFVQPKFQTVKLDGYTSPPYVDIFTYVCEKPTYLGSNKYQTAYPYIRYGISVWVGGAHKISVDDNGTSSDFIETDPDQGWFTLGAAAAGKIVYCCYHTSGNFSS